MRKFRLLALLACVLLSARELTAQPSSVVTFLNESQNTALYSQKIGGWPASRNYLGFGDKAQARVLNNQDECVVVRISPLGFTRGFVCGKESQDPEEKMERSQTVVPYFFYAKKYLSKVLRDRSHGRDYAGFGYSETDSAVLSLLPGLMGVWRLAIDDVDWSTLVQPEAKETLPPPIVPLPRAKTAPFGPASQLSKKAGENIFSTWTASPVNAAESLFFPGTPEESILYGSARDHSTNYFQDTSVTPDTLSRTAIERHFFSSPGARGYDGTAEPSYALPQMRLENT